MIDILQEENPKKKGGLLDNLRSKLGKSDASQGSSSEPGTMNSRVLSKSIQTNYPLPAKFRFEPLSFLVITCVILEV